MGRSKRADTFTGMTLHPVPADESGEGLPYAPENWPQQGDIWGWKTGKRLHNNGCFQDRYLYSPSRLSTQKGGSSRKHRHIFASKLSVERYIKSTFPDADVHAFFSSFSWRIPSLNASNGIYFLIFLRFVDLIAQLSFISIARIDHFDFIFCFINFVDL